MPRAAMRAASPARERAAHPASAAASVRSVLSALAALAALSVAAAVAPRAVAATAPNPHVNPSVVRKGCPACHTGHGLSRSPMLGEPQMKVCLRCHGSQGDVDRQVAQRALDTSARPALLGTNLSLPFQHPLTPDGLSRDQAGVVTCTSCHAPHRQSPNTSSAIEPVKGDPTTQSTSLAKPSPASAQRYEWELCEGCHGSQGAATGRRTNVSRLFNPQNRSFHPVETAVGAGTSPSVKLGLRGTQVNCTDCHGNDDPTGPKGMHGSRVRFVLKKAYATSDGQEESEATYALCYSCHDRTTVLKGTSFPQHGRHITEFKASCATCHSAHGAVGNRALVKFGEEIGFAGAAPSVKTGRIAFVSDGPGSGACYLSCHGTEHGPLAYGPLALRVKALEEKARTATPEAIRPAGPAGSPGASAQPGQPGQPVEPGARGALGAPGGAGARPRVPSGPRGAEPLDGAPPASPKIPE